MTLLIKLGYYDFNPFEIVKVKNNIMSNLNLPLSKSRKCSIIKFCEMEIKNYGMFIFEMIAL